MFGLIYLPHKIFLRKELLGKIFTTKIADVNVKIYFPSIEKIEIDSQNVNYKLIPPSFAKEWKVGDQLVNWGFISNTISKNFSVECLACSIDCNFCEENLIAAKLYYEINRWLEAFVSCCDILGRNISNLEKDTRRTTSLLDLIGSSGLIGKIPFYEVDLRFARNKQFLSAEQILVALDFTSDKKEFLTEYQLLLSAGKSKRDSRNKHAIIDVCSAAEICFNKKINEYALSIGKTIDTLEEKHGTLGDKFKLMRKIDSSFPLSNTKCKKIVDLRNDVAHSRRKDFSDEETEEVISFVEICLERYSPALF